MTFIDIFPGLSRNLSLTFQDQSDFPGISRSWNFQEKIQDFPGGVGTLLQVVGGSRVKSEQIWQQRSRVVSCQRCERTRRQS